MTYRDDPIDRAMDELRWSTSSGLTDAEQRDHILRASVLAKIGVRDKLDEVNTTAAGLRDAVLLLVEEMRERKSNVTPLRRDGAA